MKKGIAAVVLALVCTILFYGTKYMSSPLLTQKAVYGVYDEFVYTDCYFVRDEIVYTADRAGTVYNHYSDGMRTGSGVLISTVYSGNVSQEILQELNTIDKKIENARESTLFVNVSDDDSDTENRIETYKKDLISAAVDGDVNKVRAYRDAIVSLRSGTATANTSETINMLSEQKAIAEKKIGGSKQEIYALGSGIFSTVLDGMEHILTPEKVMNFTVEDFDSVQGVSEKTSNQTVNSGDSVCKVVNNHKWYVICAVASQRLENSSVGSSVSMRFDNIPGVEASGRIVNVSPTKDGRSVVVIESTQYIEGAYSMRSSKMDLIFKSYSGYKVPVYAIRTRDGVKGVLARKNNVERFYPCEIIYTNEVAEYVIIRSPKDAERKLDGVDEFVLGER